MVGGKLHPRSQDLTGQKFGLLTALEPAHSDGRKRSWVYQCQCGVVLTRVATDVKKSVARGFHPSCGCAFGVGMGTHRMTKHPAYIAYRATLQRCYNPNDAAYKNYGARGITVCARWLKGFEKFWEDMGPTWKPGLTLDRTNNDKGYSPSNCKWVTMREQTRNKRTSIKDVDIVMLSKQTGIAVSTLYYRYHRGQPLTRSTTS